MVEQTPQFKRCFVGGHLRPVFITHLLRTEYITLLIIKHRVEIIIIEISNAD
jgi:hypothetical protein